MNVSYRRLKARDREREILTFFFSFFGSPNSDLQKNPRADRVNDGVSCNGSQLTMALTSLSNEFTKGKIDDIHFGLACKSYQTALNIFSSFVL